MPNVELSTTKTVFILSIVLGCFAILWPKVFYPMFQTSVNHPPPRSHNSEEYQRQERLPHMRPELMHPALRERGRAISQSHVPQSHVVPRVESENVSPLPRPGPIPGMRPPMGAAGHVVPPPKTGSTVGILMPMYTICIVVFFVYTMMRILFRKQENTDVRDLPPDPEFRKVVFNEQKTAAPKANGKPQEPTKLVVSAIAGLVEEVNHEIKSEEIGRRLSETETKESQARGGPNIESLPKRDEESETKQVEEDIDKGAVKVVNIEMTESCTGGNLWSNSLTPRTRSPSPNITVNPPVPEPIEIYLTGSVPSESKVLVSQSETHPIPHSPGDNNSDSVVLASKVTLSLIGIDPVRRLF